MLAWSTRAQTFKVALLFCKTLLLTVIGLAEKQMNTVHNVVCFSEKLRL